MLPLKATVCRRQRWNRLLSRAETDALRLLADCEAARLRLKGGIKRENETMRRGESGLLPLLDDARSLAALR